MKAHVLPMPGLVRGAYPERRDQNPRVATSMCERLAGFVGVDLGARRYARFMHTFRAAEAQVIALSGNDAPASLRKLRAAMARHGLTDAVVAEAFVLVKRACARELGIDLFDSQVLAARVMLDQRLAEMATGEGKTLAAALSAATAALAGIPVHVITANEYLVMRDAERLAPIYAALGLSVGALTQNLGRDERRGVYERNVVYCTASELVFDYLRDGLVRARWQSDLQQRVSGLAAHHVQGRGTVLRGLCMALVDEADSILIDDARVPLILSERRENETERKYFTRALELAAVLSHGEHFVLDRQRMAAELTTRGRSMIEELAVADAVWRNRVHREETVCTALAALHLYERDRHYLVRSRAVHIIDESTGRIATGRVWSRGLHLMIELKEGCTPTADTAPLAQITYQSFFQRYIALGGMSGTLWEDRRELRRAYGLRIVKVPLARPSRRSVLRSVLYPHRAAQLQAATASAVALSQAGRAVLIGTDSVLESEEVSRRLHAAGIAHAVLNARQDRDEARVIADAGRAGQITVATNMAGRGTDIALASEVAHAGGLHVISCQHNASRRTDRQLLGRCARRGDPGSTQTLLAFDKPLIARYLPGAIVRVIPAGGLDRPQWLVSLVIRLPQRLEERRQRAQRRLLLERDRRAARNLSFGRAE